MSQGTSGREQAPILAVAGLGKSYAEGQQRRTVLADIGFQVDRGECIALVGQSGSGKSTLLNLLAGIDKPDTGDVEIMGRSLSAMGEPELTLLRRAQIGFIYQFFNLIPTLSVAENIGLPLELNGTPGRERRTLVSDWLAKVGLDGREEAFPDELSGGEQQRVAIARALIHDPALVLADEPTGNLDARTGQVVLELLAHLFRDEGRTLILVTHSRKVSEITDRVLALANGRLTDETEAISW